MISSSRRATRPHNGDWLPVSGGRVAHNLVKRHLKSVSRDHKQEVWQTACGQLIPNNKLKIDIESTSNTSSCKKCYSKVA